MKLCYIAATTLNDDFASWGENYAGSSGLPVPIDGLKDDDSASVVINGFIFRFICYFSFSFLMYLSFQVCFLENNCFTVISFVKARAKTSTQSDYDVMSSIPILSKTSPELYISSCSIIPFHLKKV